jgi:hypothetical protein
MSVSAKECSALCLHQLFDLRCEFVVLPQSKTIANLVQITVPVQPLLIFQTDEALDKLSTPYLNQFTGFVPTEHGFDHSDE